MANRISHARQWTLAAEQVFDYTDLAVSPSAVTVKIPQGGIFLRGTLLVETAFNGTTPTVSIGSSGGTATDYLAATSVAATGATALTGAAGLKASGDTLTITPNAGATASTAGKARLVIEYLISDRANEVQP